MSHVRAHQALGPALHGARSVCAALPTTHGAGSAAGIALEQGWPGRGSCATTQLTLWWLLFPLVSHVPLAS